MNTRRRKPFTRILVFLAVLILVILGTTKDNNRLFQLAGDYFTNRLKESVAEVDETKEEVTLPVSISSNRYVYGTLSKEEQITYDEVLDTILHHKIAKELTTTSTEVLAKAYEGVNADYGELFWVDGYSYTQYTLANEVTSMEFKPQYTMTKEEQNRNQNQVNAAVVAFLSELSLDASEYEKARYVFERLIQTVDYVVDSENNQNILSVFLTNETVCQGYATAAQYLLNQLGIECVIVSGTANGEPHAWNLVKIDGEYYYFDATWGNSRYLNASSESSKYVNYAYLAFTQEEMEKTHLVSSSFTLPSCTSTSATYFVREHLFFTTWDEAQIGQKINEYWIQGKESLSVKLSTKELYDQVVQYFILEQNITKYCEGLSSVYYLTDENNFIITFHFIKNN